MKPSNRQFSHITFFCFTALALSSCSNSSNSGGPDAVPPVTSTVSSDEVQQGRKNTDGAVGAAVDGLKAASLPKPDATTLISAYQPITSAEQLMFLYSANSGMPPDYESMAKSYSQDYRRTNDTFRKNDLLTALTPKLDGKIAEAKAQPYLLWQDSSPNLGHYDFKRKGFPVNTSLFKDGGFGYISGGYDVNYQLGFTNTTTFRFLSVADEALAREIEGMVGKYDDNLALKIFAFAQSTDDNRHAVLATVVKVQLLGAGDRVLVDQVAP